MNTSQVINKLKNSGWSNLENGIIPVPAFYKRNLDSPNIIDAVIILDNTHAVTYNLDHIKAIDNQLISYHFLHGCFIINSLFIVISDNIARDRMLCSTDSNKVWLYDSLCNRLVIYDNQPTCFCGIENILEGDEKIPHFKNPPILKFNIKSSFDNLISNPTYLYVALNILFFIILEFIGETYNSEFMYKIGALNYKAVVENKEYYRLITSMFMHFGFEHLLSNMVTLILLGRELEKRLNFLTYTVIYIGSGLLAGLTSIFLNSSTSDIFTISAGASGAIMGVAGALIILLVTSRVSINRSRGLRFMFIILLMCYSSFSDSSIDNFAHIGGLIAGSVITLLIHKFSK